LARGGAWRSARSLVSAAPDSAQDAARASCRDRPATSATNDRRWHRRRARDGAVDGLRGAQAVGLGKRSRLEPPEPANRYERRRPGELIHIDVKKLGRILKPGHRVTGKRINARNTYTPDGRRIGDAGWEPVHVCVDDHSRLAYAEVLTDEKAISAAGFLRRAVAFFATHGVKVERVMTDNGSPYRSQLHAQACRELGLRHLRTQPYRPRTNGKAERFIQTLLREWAYARLFHTSTERTAALQPWLNHYNYTRPHGALGHKPPGSRLTNPPRNYN
jgi:transposase InsO family protein